jgi:FkbM family methyltransferase
MGLRSFLTSTFRHPLAVGHPVRTARRLAQWQIMARLRRGEIIVPFVDDAKLVLELGLRGATQNYYIGLAEYEEMAFTLHMLRPDDLFVDVGANVGVFTALAAKVDGARVIAFEPVPETFARLQRTLEVNDIADRVQTLQRGVGSSAGSLIFTSARGPKNRVAPQDAAEPVVEVATVTLDSLLTHEQPALLKIDVEGWESEVLAGARQTLARPTLLAAIIEMNSHRAEMSANERAVLAEMTRHGFLPFGYNPRERKLVPVKDRNEQSENTIFVRDIAAVEARLKQAQPFTVLGETI